MVTTKVSCADLRPFTWEQNTVPACVSRMANSFYCHDEGWTDTGVPRVGHECGAWVSSWRFCECGRPLHRLQRSLSPVNGGGLERPVRVRPHPPAMRVPPPHKGEGECAGGTGSANFHWVSSLRRQGSMVPPARAARWTPAFAGVTPGGWGGVVPRGLDLRMGPACAGDDTAGGKRPGGSASGVTRLSVPAATASCRARSFRAASGRSRGR